MIEVGSRVRVVNTGETAFVLEVVGDCVTLYVDDDWKGLNDDGLRHSVPVHNLEEIG